MLFNVPIAKSSLGFPETVTRPVLFGCLNCRWLPRVVTRYQPSSFSRVKISFIFISHFIVSMLCVGMPQLTLQRLHSHATPPERCRMSSHAGAVGTISNVVHERHEKHEKLLHRQSFFRAFRVFRGQKNALQANFLTHLRNMCIPTCALETGL